VEIDTSLRVNVTSPSVQREALLADAAQMRRLSDILADDIRFYERYCS